MANIEISQVLATDAVGYLESVRAHLQADTPTLLSFLSVLDEWMTQRDRIANPDAVVCTIAMVIRMATILRSQPELFIGLNALLNPDYRLISSTSAIEVHYFVFTTWTGARILSISETKYRFPTSDRELRDIIVSKEAWKNLLDANPANLNKDWLTCISQLLQVVLDDPMTDALCARRAYRCLRELAMHSILPPSFFIRNLTREAGFAVQGGSFADIYKGYMGTTKVCLRVLRMFVTTTLEEQESLFKDFCVEVLVWRQLKHPNILPFIGANTEIFRSQYCFISPWMEKGDLMSYLKANPLHDRFNSICEVVDGIEYLHGLDPPVTHKDIKGANILVKEDLSCCLADFGLSSVLESQRLRTSPALQGSVCFLAPERIDPGRSPVKNATASDVYALGCTVFEIYTGKPPLSDLRLPGSIMYAILQGRRPQLPPSGHWTIKENQLWSLVERCWSDNAEDRPRISQVKRILRDSCPRTLLLKDLARPPCQTFRPDVDYFDPRKVKDWLKEQHQSHALLSMCYSRDKASALPAPGRSRCVLDSAEGQQSGPVPILQRLNQELDTGYGQHVWPMNTKGSVNAPRTITTPQGLATPTTHLLLALREYPAPAPTQCDISVGKPRVQKFDEPVIPPAKTRPPSKLDLQNNRQSEVIEASTLSRLRPDAPSFIPSSSSGAYLSNRTLNARAPSFLPAHLRPREGKIEDVSTRPEPNRLRMAQGAPSSCVNSNPPGLLVSTKALCVSSLRSEYHDDIDNV